MTKFISDLLKEYSLKVDDIRWMIANRITESILSSKESPEEITKLLWSGKLEADMYNMEEKYIDGIISQLERGLVDEAWVREQLAEASELRCKRT
jgi:hypothetical protein